MTSNKEKVGSFIVLHLILLLYSVNGLFSKLASKEAFMSLKYCLFYAIVILFLGIYAICWQQIIKRLPITIAFSNKAVTTIWGTVFGVVLFNDSINIYKIVGIVLIAVGIILFSTESVKEYEQ